MNTTACAHPCQTTVKIGRSDSQGLEGTFRNAKHHAQGALPLIEIMALLIPKAGFKEWVQFNNTHTLVTADDRQFNCRPLLYENDDLLRLEKDDHLWGIRVTHKISRTQEISIFDIRCEEDVTKAFQFFLMTNNIKPNLYSNRAKGIQ